MGWFDSIWGSSSSGSKEDPLRKLDPKLRAFLEKESPIKYNNSSQQQQQPTQAAANVTTASAATAAGSAAGAQQQSREEGNKPPTESLYQDGRYAHLWKTYRPLAEVEAETKSDHEKLMDVLEAYKDRKAQIGRAALESCAEEQMDWTACMKEGNWSARLTMCRDEVRKFERCYLVQSRMLKALGYLSVYDRPAAVDEEIQLHADALYHRMLDQEAAVEKAKAEGRPIPQFAPVFPRATAAEQADGTPLDAETQKLWKEKLDKLPEEDRAAEAEAIRAELRAKAEMASKVKDLWQEQAEQRKARREQGQETIGDKITGFFSGKTS